MTPGPWLITLGDHLIYEIANDKGPIADVYSGEADALAISAAPEMLAALQTIVKRLNIERKMRGEGYMLSALHPELEAIIAKATTAEVST